MSSYDRKTEYFTKKKSRGRGDRENFLQMYDRTCNRIYFYSYELTNNLRDADMVMRDAFIYMYDHIGEVRKQKNLDSWQKACVEKAFRALLRTRLLSLIHDDANFSASTTLSESKKEELWNKIIKMSDIDPWRMVPVPGKSSIFSVLADQTISDLRYMSAFDIVKNAAIIFFGLAAIIGGLYFGISRYIEKRQNMVNATEEIFLDERYYDEFDLSAAEKVDQSEVEAIFADAMKLEKDEEGHTLKFTFPATIGNTAAAQHFTDDLDVNQKLSDIIAKVITDDMSDFDKLGALYEYVCGSMKYEEYEGSGKDDMAVLRDALEYRAGTSRHYSVLLDALAEAAGYRGTVIEGSFVLNRDTEFERSVRHYWNRITLDGIVYYLDPEADCSADGSEIRKFYFMAASGNPRWERFEREHVS